MITGRKEFRYFRRLQAQTPNNHISLFIGDFCLVNYNCRKHLSNMVLSAKGFPVRLSVLDLGQT